MDPISILDFAFMLVASVLVVLSLSALRMLARIKVTRSLFVPVMVSAAFFWYASIVNLVFRICVEFKPSLIAAQDIINLLHQVTLTIALVILTYGVFVYWRITKHVKIPRHERLQDQSEEEE